VISQIGTLFALLAVCTLQMAFASIASAQTSIVAFSDSTYSVAIINTQAVITLVLTSGPSTATNTVDYTASDGTASNGVDYTAASGTVTFIPGTISNTFNVSILSDTNLDEDETVYLALSNPTGPVTIGSPSNAVLTILAQRGVVAFSQSAYSVDEAATDMIITLVRTGSTSTTGTIDYAATGGTASNGVDYTATTGTVTFLSGDVSNTFSVTILGDPQVDPDETVYLALSNPTGGLAIGSPSNAVLTILDQNPPELQFNAPSYSVLRHVGHATVTVERVGNSDDAASVEYATSDGTAINGTDYLGTSGLLNFAPGDTTKSFSFTLLRNPVLDNLTVNVTLSSPTGAVLGPQSDAVVTIVNDQPQTVALTDDDNDLVTLTLQKGGTMDVSEDFPLIIHLNETVDTSSLTIKVKKNKVGGDGLAEIDSIDGDGGCRRIDARNCDLTGTGISLGGYLGELRVHDISDSVTVEAGGTEDQNTTISAHDIGDDVTIDFGSHIRTLNAASFGDGTITAPSIGTMTIKGDKRNGIPGDFGGVITLSGPGVPTNNITLGKLAVAGAITNAAISIDDGNVGTITAFKMIDSSIWIGYDPDDPNNPLAGGTFVPDLLLKTVNIKSPSEGFVNSFIASAIIGSVHLRSVVTDNGDVPFGVLADQSIIAVSVKTPVFNWRLANGNDQSLGDFHVVLP
jgi:hypothetical protein